MNLIEAKNLLDKKRGSGKSESTRIKLDIDMKAGLLPTLVLVSTLHAVVEMFKNKIDNTNIPTYERVKKFEVVQYVKTDMEKNKDI